VLVRGGLDRITLRVPCLEILMTYNPLAEAANKAIRDDCPVVYDLLSEVGKSLYFPKGILTQSAEAKGKATRYNATIGIATEGGQAMHLACVQEHFAAGLKPNDLYPYMPSTGSKTLRDAWAAKQRAETPSLGAHPCSLPVVTNALTHGLALAGELFIERGDTVLLPDMLWGNYKLTWQVMKGAVVKTFPFFTPALDGFNQEAFVEALGEYGGGKLIVVLNFPNNPSGYSPTRAEAQKIVDALTKAAIKGTQLVVICDDAYYGMFYDENCETESLFGNLARAHERLLAIKIDGATKEEFVWGFRVGFITYGVKNGSAKVYAALEQKTGGCVRAQVSNITAPGQTIVLRALQHPQFRAQQAEKVAVLKGRALEVRRVAGEARYADCWEVYPFNAGYFMCLRIKGVDAEALRLHLLSEHGVGTISLGTTDLRVAFSCVEQGDIADLFDRIAQGVRALRG
jgi:aspartate/methionine/tyrosine aminotransferase